MGWCVDGDKRFVAAHRSFPGVQYLAWRLIQREKVITPVLGDGQPKRVRAPTRTHPLDVHCEQLRGEKHGILEADALAARNARTPFITSTPFKQIQAAIGDPSHGDNWAEA
jgi:hypothetical protein